MEALIAIQADHLSKLESSEKNYRKSPKDRIKRQYLEARLESLEALWQDFKTTHRQIIPLVTAEQKLTIPYFAKNVYDMFEELYIYYKATMREALQPFLKETIPSGSTSASLTQQSGSCGSDVKLPRIQLPTFNGQYNEWQTFYDMFVSLIHNNTNLSNVQKLHYLKSSLSGEPERLLSNFSTTAQNYDEAWKQLTKRYNNKRYNCNAIIKMLLSQKSILQESASAIRQLLDATTSCLKALQNLKIDTSTWDPIIVYIVVSKLDAESCRQWESQQGLQSDELPTWSSLANFLESRFRSLEMVDSNKQVSKVGTQSHHKKAGPNKSFHTALENQKVMNLKCTFCNGAHYMYSCKNFATLSQQERQDFVQNNGLCFNCLSPNHSVMRCRQSTSCRKCGRRHHSLLHFDKGQNQGLTNQETTNEMKSTETHQRDKIQQLASTLHTTQTETNIVANFSKNEFHSYHVLLATAILNVRARNSNKYVVRALIDQGSQASFITEAIVQLLGLKRFPVNGVVSGLGNGKTNIKYKVSVQLESRFNPDIKVQVSAYVLNSLTTLLPSAQVPELDWLDLDEITLADPRYSSPGKIDILLGADIYGEILLSGMIKSPSGNSIAQNTIFGWVLSGKVGQCPEDHNLTSMHIKFTEEEFDLRRFWEIEAEPDSLQKKLSETERKCEEIYERTTTRDSEGRFIVKLPFKNLDPQCRYGLSREIAERKLDFLLRRLIKNRRLYHDYQHVLEEYVSLNHMTLVEKDDIDNPKAVYLPHHAVVRADKETTKVRIVFNASSKGTNGVSLNDDLLVGPKLQQDLRHLIMRWRSHQIVIVADLEKMYRQVRVKDEDTNFQRILSKENKNGPVQHYKLLTLTFGTACAPYLAVKTLQHLADLEKTTFPKASLITKNDFYIDDLMTGGETEGEVIEIYEEMKGLMKSGKFTLQKWSSNSQSFLKYIEDDNLHSTDPMTSVPIKDSNRIKVLGLSWNRLSDNFEYIISLPDFEKPVTKRLVLSDIARLYDPIGWIAPVVIVAKLIMQKVWRAGLDWDDQITEPLLSEWLEFREKLIQIGNINIPRWIRKSQNSKMELHVFSDASRTAYAAAVYLKTIDINNKTNVCLLTAKTKVAPLDKVMSVPRLELSGADLAAKLILEVGQVMNIPKEKWYAWTDSTVVLAWLRGGASRWATFVSHRVSNILTILDYERWGHVSTSTNPVDCASRGLTPEELEKHLLWWNGPHWLMENKITLNTVNIPDTNEEERVSAFTTVNQREKEFIWDKFSSLNKMLKIMSYCRRFLNYKLEQKDRKQMPKEIQIREMRR